MAGFLDITKGRSSSALSGLSKFGTKYEDLLLKNSQAIGFIEGQLAARTSKMNAGDDLLTGQALGDGQAPLDRLAGDDDLRCPARAHAGGKLELAELEAPVAALDHRADGKDARILDQAGGGKARGDLLEAGATRDHHRRRLRQDGRQQLLQAGRVCLHQHRRRRAALLPAARRPATADAGKMCCINVRPNRLRCTSVCRCS